MTSRELVLGRFIGPTGAVSLLGALDLQDSYWITNDPITNSPRIIKYVASMALSCLKLLDLWKLNHT